MTSIPQTLKPATAISAEAFRAELQETHATWIAAPQRTSDETQLVRMRDPYFCLELI